VLERLVFHEVDARRWRDLERLFESPGGPKNCWCMVWRPLPRKSSRGDAGLKKAALKRRVEAGTPVGILEVGRAGSRRHVMRLSLVS
jgi:hypothetical protein